jgi:hypothetical protein
MNPKHDKSITLEIVKLIFKGKYQSVGRGVVKSLYFPDIKSPYFVVHRSHLTRNLAVFSKGNDNMLFCHYVGLIKAVRLIRGYLKKQSIIE